MVVNVDVPFDGPHLVVNSVINPDSVFKVRLSLNRFILDDSTETFVEDAQVLMGEEGTAMSPLTYDQSGFYLSNIKPVPGKSYNIEVQSNKFGTAKASTHVPILPGVADVEVKEYMLQHQYMTDIYITITDNPEVENYYRIKVSTEYEYYNFNDGSIGNARYPVHIYTEDPLVQNENDALGFNQFDGITFTDAFFNGKTVTLKFKSDNNFLSSGSYAIRVQNLNSDYYQYVYSTALQEQNEDDPLAQPVNVFTNVDGAFGIFGAYSQFTHQQTFPPVVIHSFEPGNGKPGDEVIIHGENLAFTDAVYGYGVSFSNGIYFNVAEVIESGDNFVKVIVPAEAVTGKILIYKQGRIGISETDFIVE